jgi:formylglycine-generating enzyme required for sulfatase activity
MLGGNKIKSFKPNGYGPYNMIGNVSEWVQTGFDLTPIRQDAANKFPVNPTAPPDSDHP